MKKINKANILEIKDLNVKYSIHQEPIIKNFGIEIKKGDHLAIIGPSGCGKTTFAKTIVNMLPKGSITEGYISIAGKDPRKIKKEEMQ